MPEAGDQPKTAVRQYGLPERMRSENGEILASVELGRLNPLSIWWLKLGIVLERIEPGEPQQEWRPERMGSDVEERNGAPAQASRRA